jgi:outer membrane murein-binding lipoprotein Lpp
VITFRYHIVSLIAVFLALALGIVVGTTALNGPVTSDLRRQVNSLRSDRSDLAAQVKALNSEVQGAGLWVTAFGPKLIGGTLTKQSVLIIGLPGASTGMQNGVATELTAAGAQISGQLELNANYIDPAEGASIQQLATGPSRPKDLILPDTNDAGRLGAAMLAYVLLGMGSSTDLPIVLAAFARLNMIGSDPQGIAPATNVVVVGSGANAKSPAGAQDELDLINALSNKGGKVVVAGDSGSAAVNGVIALVRGGSAKSSVSTVDNANTPIGQVSIALALVDSINSQVGQYGTGPGASQLFPNPSN